MTTEIEALKVDSNEFEYIVLGSFVRATAQYSDAESQGGMDENVLDEREMDE